MKTPAQILEEARQLIEDPAHWTRFAFGRLPNGDSVSGVHPKACQWCAVGAVHRASVGDWDQRLEALDRLWVAVGHGGAAAVTTVNDYGTHEEVLAVFDRAIALARGVA